MGLTPRRKQDRAPFGRKGTAPAEAPAPEAPAGAEAAPAHEAPLDLTRATLAIDDGLLMVLGPEGDPLPPATLAALAADQPDAALAFEDGTQVPARRVAEVLEAQSGGRLAPADGDATAWLRSMLGAGPAPAMASEHQLEAERDDPEITLFGQELVISTAAGSFVIAAARPDGTAPAAQVALDDGTPLPPEDLLGRLRRAAGQDADADQTAEVTLPGCAIGRDGDALVLSRAPGETFVLTVAGDGATGGIALYTPDGESVTLAGLADALGLAEAGPEPGALEADEVAPQPAAPPEADDDPGVPEPGHAKAPDAPSARPRDTDPQEDQAQAADAAPPPAPDDGPGTDDEPGQTAEPAHEEAQRPIPLACRFGVDDPARVAMVLITGVPAGAVLSAGSDNGDGSWTLSPDQLEALAITPPADAPEPLALEAKLVTIDDRDGAMSMVSRELALAPEAEDGDHQPPGPEAALRLDLDAVVREAAGDRPASAVVVGGLPADATLSAGLFDHKIRSWVIKPHELSDLWLHPPASTGRPLALRVTVVTMDPATGKPAATTRNIELERSCPPHDPGTDRPAERVGGVGFFRPLYDRRR